MLTCICKLTFCAAHRLLGHEGACANLHGHNYVVEVTATGGLDAVGRVIDFGVIKERLGGWLDENWDHGLIYNKADLDAAMCAGLARKSFAMYGNPTAENMADYLLRAIVPRVFAGLGITITRIRVWETETGYADAVPDQ